MVGDLDEYVKRRSAGNLRFRAGLAAGEAVAQVGKQIKAARTQKGLTVAQLAHLSGLTTEALTSLEDGWSVDLSIDDLFVLAEILGLTVRLSLEPGAPESGSLP